MESATALTDCELVRINKKAMMEPLHREHELSDMSTAYLLGRKEEDLVEYIVASDERLPARYVPNASHCSFHAKTQPSKNFPHEYSGADEPWRVPRIDKNA
jgi:CRP/FNR family transcriptional regulator, cyclic AMP receptor protein